MYREHLTRDELRQSLSEWADEAENSNRHEFCAALHDLAKLVDHLNVGDTFFGVVDFDAYGQDRFALAEIVDG